MTLNYRLFVVFFCVKSARKPAENIANCSGVALGIVCSKRNQLTGRAAIFFGDGSLRAPFDILILSNLWLSWFVVSCADSISVTNCIMLGSVEAFNGLTKALICWFSS